MTSLKNTILATVHKERITMIPKWRFVLYSLLATGGLVFLFLLTVFFGSLLMFVLSRYGFMDMPFFHFMKMMHTIAVIPLLLVLCTLVLLGIVEFLTRRHAFTFKQPLLVTLLGITTLTLGLSFLVSESGMHERMRNFAKEKHMPFVSRAYEKPFRPRGIPGTDIVRGIVVATTSTSTVLKTFDGSLVTIFSTSSSLNLPLGEDMVAFGSYKGEVFEAGLLKKAHRPPFRTDGEREKRVREGMMK